jgi:signal transduction histidine kinase
MAELLRESVRRFGETEEGNKQPVELTTEAGHVMGDGGRLRQVVRNLLVNAASFSAEGQPIAVAGRRWGLVGYEIVISDRGPGISPEDRTKIFEPFFSKRTGGSGLGLSVCMGIARAHGGTIAVENNPHGGATFRVRIPGSPTRPEGEAS